MDVTIKDERPGAPTVTKVVSVVVTSDEQGRVRTIAHLPGVPVAPLNVDAYPRVDRGRIVLRLGLEYGLQYGKSDQAAQSPGSASAPSVHIGVNESIVVVLEDGKPMVVTQSADPLTDRKVTVEVKATILK